MQPSSTSHGNDASAQRGSGAVERVRLPDVLGRYRLGRPLGAGGMGMVFEAFDGEADGASGETVALKLVRPAFSIYESSRLRFQREVEASSRLSHPSIVRVLEVGEEGDHLFFTMERVPGVSLGEVITALKASEGAPRTGALLWATICELSPEQDAPRAAPALFDGTWSQVCFRVAQQVAAALAHAHERGVLHRDVKPSNILVTPAGRVVLVDFGLASLQGAGEGRTSLTKTGSRLGSLQYMPPEALTGKTHVPGPHTDVYELGVTLYELLTLRPAFSAADTLKLESAIRAGRAPSPRGLCPGLSLDGETVVLKAMSIEPDRRYSSADALASDLELAAADRPVAAKRMGPVGHTRRWIQRHPAAAMAIAAATVILLAGSAAFAGWQRVTGQRLAEANQQLRDERQRVTNNLTAALGTVREQLQLLQDPKLRRLEFAPLRESLIGSITSYMDQLLGVESTDPLYVDTRAQSLFHIGCLEIELGRYRSSFGRFEEHRTLLEGMLGAARADGDSAVVSQLSYTLLTTHVLVGVNAEELGDLPRLERALEDLDGAIAAYRAVGGDADLSWHQSAREWLSGLLLLGRGELAASREHFQRSNDIELRNIEKYDRAERLTAMSNTDYSMAESALREGRLKLAVQYAEVGLERLGEALDVEPNLYWGFLERGRMLVLYGELQLASGDRDAARRCVQRAEADLDRWVSDHGPLPRVLPLLAGLGVLRGDLLAKEGRRAEGLAAAQEGLQHLEVALEDSALHAKATFRAAVLCRRAASIAGGAPEGRELAQRADRLLRAVIAEAPEHPLFRAERAMLDPLLER